MRGRRMGWRRTLCLTRAFLFSLPRWVKLPCLWNPPSTLPISLFCPSICQVHPTRTRVPLRNPWDYATQPIVRPSEWRFGTFSLEWITWCAEASSCLHLVFCSRRVQRCRGGRLWRGEGFRLGWQFLKLVRGSPSTLTLWSCRGICTVNPSILWLGSVALTISGYGLSVVWNPQERMLPTIRK